MPGVKDTASPLSYGNTQPRLRTSIRLEDIALIGRHELQQLGEVTIIIKDQAQDQDQLIKYVAEMNQVAVVLFFEAFCHVLLVP